jgi:hypothetical protein
VIVRCRCCFRSERWVGPDHEVLAEGGARRLEGAHPTWDVLRRVRDGTLGPVMGPCPSCGRPLVLAEGIAVNPLDVWPLETLPGRIEVPLRGDRAIPTPAGPLDTLAFTLWLGAKEPPAALHRDTIGGLSQLTLVMLVAIVPILGWLWAAAFLAVFLIFGLWGP